MRLKTAVVCILNLPKAEIGRIDRGEVMHLLKHLGLGWVVWNLRATTFCHPEPASGAKRNEQASLRAASKKKSNASRVEGPEFTLSPAEGRSDSLNGRVCRVLVIV